MGKLGSWNRKNFIIKYHYHCNDGEFDDDFDDLVFRLKILEGAREE